MYGALSSPAYMSSWPAQGHLHTETKSHCVKHRALNVQMFVTATWITSALSCHMHCT
jgi:hypothetical protein